MASKFFFFDFEEKKYAEHKLMDEWMDGWMDGLIDWLIDAWLTDVDTKIQCLHMAHNDVMIFWMWFLKANSKIEIFFSSN